MRFAACGITIMDVTWRVPVGCGFSGFFLATKTVRDRDRVSCLIETKTLDVGVSGN